MLVLQTRRLRLSLQLTVVQDPASADTMTTQGGPTPRPDPQTPGPDHCPTGPKLEKLTVDPSIQDTGCPGRETGEEGDRQERRERDRRGGRQTGEEGERQEKNKYSRRSKRR